MTAPFSADEHASAFEAVWRPRSSVQLVLLTPGGLVCSLLMLMELLGRRRSYPLSFAPASFVGLRSGAGGTTVQVRTPHRQSMTARHVQQRASGTAAARQPARAQVRRPGSLSGFSSSRARIVGAMRELACEQGYQAVSATALISRARVSSKTFYENFADTDACFITTYVEATGEIEAVMRPAYMRPGSWTQRVRAALEALLLLLEADRELAALVFLEAPKARDLLGARRARILEIFQLVLDSGRSGENPAATPILIAELLVEGAISVIRARVASPEEGSLTRLLEELMGVITYAYIGPASTAVDSLPIAVIETAAPGAVIAPPRLPPGRVVAVSPEPPPDGRPAQIRVTFRTLMVLTAVLENPGASNRQVAEVAGIDDQGQISRILRRLSNQELVRNDGAPRNGAPKRWHLTHRGLALQRRGQRDLDRRTRAHTDLASNGRFSKKSAPVNA